MRNNRADLIVIAVTAAYYISLLALLSYALTGRLANAGPPVLGGTASAVLLTAIEYWPWRRKRDGDA